MLMMPSGSGLGNVGTDLQPSRLAAAACWYLVEMDETTLYRTKAAKAYRVSKRVDCMVSRWR